MPVSKYSRDPHRSHHC